MGISGMETFMEENYRTFRDISLHELLKSRREKVIVVDGNTFISTYVMEHIQVVTGGIIGFAETMRRFVLAFEALEIKLVFFFEEIFVSVFGEKVWAKHRRHSVKHAQKILRGVERQEAQEILPLNFTWHPLKPHDMHCWAIGVLQEMKCELHCTTGNRVWQIAKYARENNCLAILCQTSYFVFFKNLRSSILSLKHLDLSYMTTKEYDGDAMAEILQLNKKFYPLLATLMGSNSRRRAMREYVFQEIQSKVSDPSISPCILAATYIRENYKPSELREIPNILTRHFPQYATHLLKAHSTYKDLFMFDVGNLENFTNCSIQLNTWEAIKEKCGVLLQRGKLCGRIHSIIKYQRYEEFVTVEDFKDFPPTSMLYRKLRKSMYSILLHEAEGFVDRLEVSEWCIEGWDSPFCPIPVSVRPMDSSLHPGLLALWDSDNENDELTDQKWRLFCSAVSPMLLLRYNCLRDLNKNLIIPVALVYYLVHELTNFLSDYEYAYLHPFEIDVLIVVVLTIYCANANYWRSRSIRKLSVRGVRLLNVFISGCDVMKMIAQSCGLELPERDVSIFNFFDGKLFSILYEEAQSGEAIIHPNSAIFREYDWIRNIILNILPTN